MSKNTNVKSQLIKCYLYNALGNISIAGAAWVLLLVSRGFSLIEVGLAETVFHLVSITGEIPSGMIADTMGRKKSLALSCLFGIASCFAMAFWDSFLGVCVSIACSALSYNFMTGADNALAYDTLAEQAKTELYDGYVSNQTVIYRITNGLATLMAGLALILGNVTSQMIGVVLHVLQLAVVLTMAENTFLKEKTATFRQRFVECYTESFRFLKGNKKVARLIYRNCIVGAVDILLLFFLQAKLPMTGISDWLLGPLLFIMSMGGVVGAFAAGKVKRWQFRSLFFVTLTLVCLGFIASFTGIFWIMTLGGFVAAFADDLIQIRADVELNTMVPAAQRATLISVNSLCFSLVMIVLSPLAGWVFSL